MDDRGKALAKSRAELRPLAEWFWDALDASAVGSRNAAARLAGYNKNIAYAAFEGQQLIKLVQARELAEALDADLAETEKLWYTARRALGALASADDQAQAVSAEESLVKPARRLRRHWRLALAGTVAVIVIAAALGYFLTRAPGDTVIMANGDVAMIREGGAPRLIFPAASGGIGYCIRSDDDWSRPWTDLMLDSDWPGISRASIFFSGFSGFEVLGVNNGILTFGYRDNMSHWHDPKPVLDDRSGDPVQGVTGRPGFFQYWPDHLKDAQFLALVPVDGGGLDLYLRDGISQQWHMTGNIATGLGRISSVSLTYLQGQEINVILRVGSRLYELTRSSQGLPGEIAANWSEPRELMINGGQHVAAAGDPSLIYSDVIGDVADNTFWLAVPVQHGLALLSTRDTVSGQWSVEAIPVQQQPDSVALMEGYTDGSPNVEVAYRQGTKVYSLWRPDGGAWRGPEEIRC
jgi:hypothetical protein